MMLRTGNKQRRAYSVERIADRDCLPAGKVGFACHCEAEPLSLRGSPEGTTEAISKNGIASAPAVPRNDDKGIARNDILNAKKGFTLVEVILSVAIVTAGLVFVLQAMGKQINIVSLSNDKTETALFLKEKTGEVMRDLSKKEKISPFLQTGEAVKNGRTYKWVLNVNKNADYKGLYDINLKCSWSKFGKGRESVLETRLYKAEKESEEK